MSFLVHAIITRIKNCKHVLILISYRYLRLRAVAYCWLVLWLCGYLGWDNLRPLPVYIYHHIRSEFPSINASIRREHVREIISRNVGNNVLCPYYFPPDSKKGKNNSRAVASYLKRYPYTAYIFCLPGKAYKPIKTC